MKITKKLIRNIVIIGMPVLCLLIIGIIFLSSWAGYQGYYERMMELRRQMADANKPSVTTFNGIELKVAEGRGFYDNGRSAPTKADFVLEGKYAIDGREYAEEITEYTLTVPEDFAANGGRVTADYIHRETKTVEVEKVIETESGTETVVEEEEQTVETPYSTYLDLSLETVVPQSLMLEHAPYTTVYPAGAQFDPKGMNVTVKYNDGTQSTASVPLADLTIPDSALTEDTTGITVSARVYGYDVSGNVPVRVEPADTFDNGTLRDLVVDGDVKLPAGDRLSSLAPTVLGRYASGNYVALKSDEYLLDFNGEDNVPVAVGEKYRMTATLKANLDMQKTVNVYVTEEKAYTSATVEGNTVSFTVNSAESTYSDLYADLSGCSVRQFGGYYYVDGSAVSSLVRVSLNGEVKALNADTLMFAGPFETEAEAKLSVSHVNLGKFNFNEGRNTVSFELRADGLQVNGITVYSYDNSRIIENFGQYVEACEEEGVNITYRARRMTATGRLNGLPQYQHGVCTDGTYVYVGGNANNTTADIPNPARIYKLDIATGNVIGSTKPTSKEGNPWTNNEYLFYKDGNVYMVKNTGEIVYAKASDITGTDSVELQPADLTFSASGTVVSAGYSFVQNKYVVVDSSKKVTIYDANTMEPVGKTNTLSGNIVGVYCDGEYIYALTEASANNDTIKSSTANMNIFRWDGSVVKTGVRLSGLLDMANSNNVQGMFTLKGEIYFLICAWSSAAGNLQGSQSSGAYLAKITLDESVFATDEEVMSLGAYIDACKAGNKTPEYAKTIVGNSNIAGIPRYVHGLCSDGEFAYITSNEPSPADMYIYKVDVSTGKLIGKSKPFTKAASTSNKGYLFHKDGNIYLVKDTGDIVYVKADDIGAGSTDPELLPANMTFTGLASGETVHAVSYDASTDRYAVLTAGASDHFTLHSADGKTLAATRLADYYKAKHTGIYCDGDYIYTFNEGAASTAKFDVYNWSGTKLHADVLIPGLLDTTASNNIQGMAVIGGKPIFIVCGWGSSGSRSEGAYLTFATPNQKILKDDASTSLGAQVDAAVQAGTTLSYTASNLSGNGKVGNLPAFTHGLCSDGTNLYVSACGVDGQMRIYKVDASGNVITSSEAYQKETYNTNTDFLFYKDGKVYMVKDTGDIVYVEADAFVSGSNPAYQAATDMTFTGVSGKILAVSYDAVGDRFVIVTTGKAVYSASAKTMEAKLIRSTYEAGKPTGVYCDSGYIYLMYEGAVSTATMHVIDWEGNYAAATLGVAGLNAATSGNNVQAMCAVGGNTYFLVCQWQGSGDFAGGAYIVKVAF